jgi:hypothetical protein
MGCEWWFVGLWVAGCGLWAVGCGLWVMGLSVVAGLGIRD